MAHKASQEVLNKVGIFETADQKFREAFDAFEQANSDVLQKLEELREARNIALDDAKRAVRDEADNNTDDATKSIAIGRFTAMKKDSIFYIPQKFIAMLYARDLYDAALKAEVVKITTTIPYVEAKSFLEKNGIEDEFEECEDGIELTTAVTCPKPVPAFGSETKGK